METKTHRLANKRWRRRHRKQNRYISYRSTCRTFLKIMKPQDVPDIKKRFEKRLQELKR